MCSAFGKLNIIVNNAGYTWDGMLHKVIIIVAFIFFYCNVFTFFSFFFFEVPHLLHSQLQMSDQQWDAMLKVHNTAPFRLIRAAAPVSVVLSPLSLLCPPLFLSLAYRSFAIVCSCFCNRFCCYLVHARRSTQRSGIWQSSPKPCNSERVLHFRPARKCWTSQLCNRHVQGILLIVIKCWCNFCLVFAQ